MKFCPVHWIGLKRKTSSCYLRFWLHWWHHTTRTPIPILQTIVCIHKSRGITSDRPFQQFTNFWFVLLNRFNFFKFLKLALYLIEKFTWYVVLRGSLDSDKFCDLWWKWLRCMSIDELWDWYCCFLMNYVW